MQHSCSHYNAICNHNFKKSHFTRKNARFRAPASSPTHHFPSSPLPIVTTSHRHHLPSSTSLRHHFPSSPLPIVPTSLPHHSPSSSLPFVTTSHRHHFPSSPLPFVTTSHRHHFPSSPLPFVTTSLRHHPSLSPPFIKVNSTASYSFVMYCYVMYCYVIYHPASCQVAEFYLSVTRKYCFPTSFDDYICIYIYVCVCFILYSHIIFPWEEDGCRTSDELFTAPRLPMLPGHGQLSMGPMSVNDVCVMVPAWCHGFNPEQKQRPFTQGKMLSACRKGTT